jgi:hypothetical protein
VGPAAGAPIAMTVLHLEQRKRDPAAGAEANIMALLQEGHIV